MESFRETLSVRFLGIIEGFVTDVRTFFLFGGGRLVSDWEGPTLGSLTTWVRRRGRQSVSDA